MDIRVENAQNPAHPLHERVVNGKKREPVKDARKPEEDDRAEIKTADIPAPEPVMISREELEDFMLLLTTSNSSPRLFNRYIDEKRKDRIDLLLNSHI